jgi:hypothetical protein
MLSLRLGMLSRVYEIKDNFNLQMPFSIAPSGVNITSLSGNCPKLILDSKLQGSLSSIGVFDLLATRVPILL